MANYAANPYEPATVTSGSTSPQRAAPTSGEIAVRALYGMESAAWALVVFFGVYLWLGTQQADFPNREMALNGELVFTCWAVLMMMLAIAGLVRAKGLLFRGPVATSVAIGVRLFTLVPMTAVMLVIAAAGFVA